VDVQYLRERKVNQQSLLAFQEHDMIIENTISTPHTDAEMVRWQFAQFRKGSRQRPGDGITNYLKEGIVAKSRDRRYKFA
jgi:hypothetical protein